MGGSWETARAAEKLLVRVYKEGPNEEISKEIADLVTTDCIGGPESMIWDCMARVRDDERYGPNYVKEVVRRVVGPFQETPAMASHVHSVCCMSLALSALEKCDVAGAMEHLERGLELDHRATPTADDVKKIISAVMDWAADHMVEVNP